MRNSEYLSEEKYKKVKRNITIIATIILVAGILGSGYLFAKAFMKSKSNTNNTEFTEQTKQERINSLNSQIDEEKTILETKKEELKAKGLKDSPDYQSGEAYDLYIIINALDPSFPHCDFDEYKTNAITSKYCTLKEELKNVEEQKDNDKTSNLIFNTFEFMPAVMILLITLGISINLFYIANKRKITAFHAQQVMPIADEMIDKATPTIAKSVGKIAESIKDSINNEDIKK